MLCLVLQQSFVLRVVVRVEVYLEGRLSLFECAMKCRVNREYLIDRRGNLGVFEKLLQFLNAEIANPNAP